MPTLPLNIKPFIIPDVVYLELPVGRRQDGMQPLPQVKLADVPRDTLEEMCEAFKNDILNKAGYADDKTEYNLTPIRGIGC